MLARQGDENGLRALAEQGARDAQHKLALLLGKRAALGELKAAPPTRALLGESWTRSAQRA
jgi:hypothetical protein